MENLNKTFARRVGKALTTHSKTMLEEILPIYSYSADKMQNSHYPKKYLEIGFGMGEHFLHQLQQNKESLYIGAEVYINGVASVLKKASSAELSNYLLWADDVDMLFANIPNHSLDGVYILFPDPWHKRRYLKKRLVNQKRFDIIKYKIKIGGFFAFASDIEDYFQSVLKLVNADSDFILAKDNYTLPHENYIQTKYHGKAIQEGRVAQFLTGFIR